MKKNRLPPYASDVSETEIKWKRIEDQDFHAVGFMLSCHLVIEHYLDEFLHTESPNLNWNSARLTFAQKIGLISKFEFKEPYTFVPALKHLNNLRNRISHNLTFRPSQDDLLPFVQFIDKVRKSHTSQEKDLQPIPNEPAAIIELFTHSVCAWLAGCITFRYQHSIFRYQRSAHREKKRTQKS